MYQPIYIQNKDILVINEKKAKYGLGQVWTMWGWREEFLFITLSKQPIWLIWTAISSYDVASDWSLPQMRFDTDSDILTASIKHILTKNKNLYLAQSQ
jgi:hypothetical protein